MEKGICLSGLVEKIKIVKLEENPLIRFTLASDEGTKVNCLIGLHALHFLYQVNEGSAVVVFGQKNSRNQIVVKKYHVKAA